SNQPSNPALRAVRPAHQRTGAIIHRVTADLLYLQYLAAGNFYPTKIMKYLGVSLPNRHQFTLASDHEVH
ncbi:MAG: hypothetical protein WCS62_04300, partial [Bacilli bacterium]